MADHGIELVKLLDASQYRTFLVKLLPRFASRLEPGDVHHQIFPFRQKLVQRRVDRADGDGTAPHRLEHAVEVLTLQGQELVQGFPPIGFGVGEDHPLDDWDSAFAKEHVLGPA